MAVQGVSGMAVAAAVIGWMFIYSGIRGTNISKTVQALVGGKPPPAQDPNLAIDPTFDASGGSSSSSSGGGTATAPTNASESAFITSVLQTMGAPANSANINSLSAWFKHEFSSWPPRAANNPMATTQSEPGASTYNSVGVKNYPDALTGVKATVATLENGNYPTIVANLKAGKGICGGGMASEFSKWSGGGYSSVC